MGIRESRRITGALRRPITVGAALATCALVATGAAAHEPSGGLELRDRPPTAVKAASLDSSLARLARAEDHAAAANRLGLDLAGGRVQVEVHAGDDPAAAAAAIRTAGGAVDARYQGLLEASVPAGVLDELAADPDVRAVEPLARPQPLAVTGEGVASTRADDWIAAGNGGAGVEIAVIDVGFAGWQARRDEGELPAGVATADFCGPDGFDADASDHGTAVAEVVHEVAPAAALLLICADSLVTLAQAKDYAKSKGVHIVNHSVGWHNTARGDGSGGPTTPDGIAADARANGILWVNAAGNEAGRHWSGSFMDDDGDGWHEFEFAPEVVFEGNGVAVPQGEELCAYLRWDDWPGSAQDYDLYLYPPGTVSPADFVARSTNVQSGSQSPVEELCYANPNPTMKGGAPDLYLAIRRYSATVTPRFDLFTTHDFVRPAAGGIAVAEGSLLEPAASPSVLTVTAVCWADKSIEPFSSRGPTLDPAVAKPDVAGPDGVSSATQGPFVNCGADVSGFFGTSAAAPHVAAAAALLKQVSPASTPAQLHAELEARTADLGVPGRDTLYGAGLLSLGAVPAGHNPAPAAPTNTGSPSISGTAQQDRTLTATTGAWTGPAVVLYAYQWRRCDAGGGACSDIGSALDQSYAVSPADVDATLRVDVTAINGGGGTTATSAPTALVAPPAPKNTGLPAISGRARVGETLSATIGGWSGLGPLAYAFAWLRCDVDGSACTSLGAAGSTYVVTSTDVGRTLRAAVTATNRGGATAASSAPTAAVAPVPPQSVAPPTVAGTPRAGRALTASTGTWRDASSYSYRWWRCVRSACAFVDGATARRFVLRNADVGARFRAVVTATNAAGSTSAHSTVTRTVAARAATGLAASTLRLSRRALAGRRFAVTITVARRSGAALHGQLGCSARIGRYVVPRTQRTLRAGVARCAWAVPTWAAGRRLTGTVRVSAAGNSVVRRFSRVVGR